MKAQSTAGTEFWLTFGKTEYSAPANTSVQIRIVGGSAATNGTIYFTDLPTSVDFYIPPHQVFTHELTPAQREKVYNSTTGITNYSIHITTTGEPVTVYAWYGIGAFGSSEATYVLPVTALGTEYYQISYTEMPNYQDTYTVVATQSNTEVFHNGASVGTLNIGQVYCQTSADMTGAHITSDKPVAFFACHKCTLIPNSSWAPSCLMEQLPPVHTWGRTFFVPVSHLAAERVRIVASKNNTTIDQTGGTVVQGSLTLNAGQWVELDISSNGCFIEADNPIGVCSYIKTDNTSAGTMPSQAWIPGIEQSISSTIITPFITPSTYYDTEHYALILTSTAAKNDTRVSVGGAPPTGLSGGSWTDNLAKNMSFYSMPLTEETTSYTFSNENKFIIWGYGVNIPTYYMHSYYYLAGSNMYNLSAAFSANNVPYDALFEHVFCEHEIEFVANIEGIKQEEGSLKWYIDTEEEISARDQTKWSKTFAAGTYTIEMVVIFEDESTETYEGILTIGRCGECLDLYATGISSEGCIELEWDWLPPPPTGTYGFTLYQWDDKLGDWQTASTNYDKSIEVLNVYPDIEAGSNTLQTWMSDPEIGLGKINVTPVGLTDFNANPNSYLKSGGEYAYDAIMFGSWDSNCNQDLLPASADAVRDFLDSGRGVIFGHDTQREPLPNFASLSDKTNVYIGSGFIEAAQP